MSINNANVNAENNDILRARRIKENNDRAKREEMAKILLMISSPDDNAKFGYGCIYGAPYPYYRYDSGSNEISSMGTTTPN